MRLRELFSLATFKFTTKLQIFSKHLLTLPEPQKSEAMKLSIFATDSLEKKLDNRWREYTVFYQYPQLAISTYPFPVMLSRNWFLIGWEGLTTFLLHSKALDKPFLRFSRLTPLPPVYKTDEGSIKDVIANSPTIMENPDIQFGIWHFETIFYENYYDR